MKLIEQHEEEVVLSLDMDELRLILAGLTEALEAIADTETEIRMGLQRSELWRLTSEVLLLVRRNQQEF